MSECKPCAALKALAKALFARLFHERKDPQNPTLEEMRREQAELEHMNGTH